MVGRDGIEPPTPGFSVPLGPRHGTLYPGSHVSIRRLTRLSPSIHHRWRRVPPNETVQVWGKSRDPPCVLRAPTCHAKKLKNPKQAPHGAFARWPTSSRAQRRTSRARSCTGLRRLERSDRPRRRSRRRRSPTQFPEGAARRVGPLQAVSYQRLAIECGTEFPLQDRINRHDAYISGRQPGQG
jgi:hypothetical protein